MKYNKYLLFLIKFKNLRHLIKYHQKRIKNNKINKKLKNKLEKACNLKSFKSYKLDLI